MHPCEPWTRAGRAWTRPYHHPPYSAARTRPDTRVTARASPSSELSSHAIFGIVF